MFVITIEMRRLVITVTVIVVVLMDSTDGQYPSCVDNCPDGKYVIMFSSCAERSAQMKCVGTNVCMHA